MSLMKDATDNTNRGWKEFDWKVKVRFLRTPFKV